MNESPQQNDLVFKVIVIGDSGCGKSCLIQRYITNEFMDEYTVTLGVEYHSKIVKIQSNINIKLQFWDTAGQEAFHSLVKSFYRGSHAVIMVYDITRRQTFDNLDFWHQQALQNSPLEAIYVVIGTHIDQSQNREVTSGEAQEWVKEANVQMYFQTSAKTAENVSKAFDEICKQLLTRKIKHRKDANEAGMKLTNDAAERSFCC